MSFACREWKKEKQFLEKPKPQLNTTCPVKLAGRCCVSCWCVISLVRHVLLSGNSIAILTVGWKRAVQNSTWLLDLFKDIMLAWQVLLSKKESRWLALILYPFFNPSLIEPCRNYPIILLGLMRGLQAFNYPGCLICPLIALAQDPLPFPLKMFPWHFEI